MTKELSKSITNRSRFKNRYLKWPSRENFLAYKKAKTLCNSLNRKAQNTYFGKATENGIMGSKKSWSTGKPFLSSKGFIHNNDIKIEIDNKIIEDESELTKTFNSHYISIVKSTTGKHPTKLGTLATGIYLLKVNNRNTRTRCEICSKLTIKTPMTNSKMIRA